MKIHGIKEVSKMLAEFNFAGVKGEVAIEVSPYESAELYYDDYDDDDSPWCSGWDFDTCRFKLYDESESNLNPETWDEEAWAKFIDEDVEKIQEYHLMSCTRCGKEYTIGIVYIEYESSRGDGKELCSLCSVVDGARFAGIYVPEPSDVHISLDDADIEVKSSDDVIKIVCTCTELDENDFVRID